MSEPSLNESPLSNPDPAPERPIPFLLRFPTAFLMAVAFLTRMPVPERILMIQDPRAWRLSFLFYPLVGALIGAFSILPTLLIAVFTREDPAMMLASAVLYVALLEWSCRFLHFDGFCDACDGFAAMTPDPERRLQIMKDPHLGSAGVAGGAFLIGAKILFTYLLFTKIVLFFQPLPVLFIAMAVPAFARFAALLAGFYGHYPRKKGTAMLMVGNVSRTGLIVNFILLGVFFSFFYALILNFGNFLSLTSWNENLAQFARIAETFRNQSRPELQYFFLQGLRSFCIFSMSLLLPVIYWHTESRQKIGGTTGDILGAVEESSEMLLLLISLMLFD